MMADGALLGSDSPDLNDAPLVLASVSCNDTCCKYSEDDIICFSELNYTDSHNLTHVAAWELGVRWSYASLVTLMAVLGNLSIIIILDKNRLLLRSSVNQFILNMSVADLITALAGPIPFTIRDTNTFWPLGETWCYLEGYIQMLVMLVSVTSLATISCDRMIGVVRPFHQHLRKWQSLAIIIAIWVSSALLAVPWGVYRVYTVHIWEDMTQTNCGENEKLQIWWIVAVVGLAWLPLSVMVVCYTIILVYFHHRRFQSSFRNEHPVITHLKKRVVKMMFVVEVIFTVCWLPFTILQISYTSFLDDYGQFKDDATAQRYNELLTVSQYMIYINPALNPIIYGLLHQTFRRAFRVTFPCIFKRKSSLVLTRGQGLSRYMWSVKSASSHTCDSATGRPRARSSSSLQQPSQLHDPTTTTTTPQHDHDPTTTITTTPQHDHDPTTTTTTTTPQHDLKKSKKKKVVLLASDHDQVPSTKKVNVKRYSFVSVCSCDRNLRKRSKKVGGEGGIVGVEGGIVGGERRRTVGVMTEGDGNLWRKSYSNEGYVRDLPPTRFSIVSTGRLGDLVKQVIVEETSSDVENERIL